MKICFFADGQSVHTQRWLKEIAARGIEVTLITRRPWCYPGIREFVISPRMSGSAGWFIDVFRIRRLIRKLRPDIVHGHYLTSYGFWAAICGKKPLVLTAWGSDVLVTPKRNKLLHWLTGWTLSRADLITADSLDTLEEIRGYAVPARLEQVQWGVDLDRIRPVTEKSSPVLSLISLRSWEQNYNIDTILHSFARLRAKRPELQVHLHLLGGGTQESKLKEMAKKLSIDRQVSFHGKVGESTLLEILSRADISVSVPDSDATAMSLLESMAAGLPVVVSELPANRQWVDQKGGRFVLPGDIAGLTDAILELAASRDLRQSMGRHNRAIVEVRASRRLEMDKMVALYRTLYGQKSNHV